MITAIAIVKHDGIHLRKTFDPSHAEQSIPIVLEYLAEGAANVVLRLTPFVAASKLKTAPPELKDKLLRVRKNKRALATVAVQHAHISEVIGPLFHAENLVQHLLVTVDPFLLGCINEDLRELGASGHRPEIRIAEEVATDELNALLITDMSAIGTEIALEFKPKWLAQSPNAPTRARRCRTCALRAYRRAVKGAHGPDQNAFCPLALIAEDDATRLRAARAIVSSRGQDMMKDESEPFAAALREQLSPLLSQLGELQQQFDPHGILAFQGPADVPSDLSLAMTLRDCTMFVRVRETFRSGPLEVRLADLDVKLTHPDRMHKWRSTEQTLIEGGWYENTEDNAVLEQICILSTKGTDV